MLLSEGVVRISFREEAFQVRFQEPFRMTFFLTVLVGEVFLLYSGSTSLIYPVLLVPLFAAVWCAVAILFVSWRYQFQIGPEGIECYDFWCQPQSTNWQSITGCRYVSGFGLEYLLISSTESRPIWVPLFVERYDILRDLLVCYSNPDLKLDAVLPEA